jgi:hypothetical protein
MKRFVEAVKNMFRIQDLRNRVLFTLALLAVYRIGAYIPIPGINSAVLDQLFNQAAGSMLGIFNLFSGGKHAGVPIEVAEKLKALERENRELRQANEILRKASAYFALAELDRPFKR